jgi:hypothetical protein
MPTDKLPAWPERTVWKFLIFLSGARPDILRHVPSERTAFAVRGASVLASGVIFAAATAQSLIAVVSVNAVLAVAAGLAVGFVVCMVERFPAPKPASWGGRLLSLAPRILFATVLGVLLAQLTLIFIFRPEINAQIAQSKLQREQGFAAAQASSALARDIVALQRQVALLQEVIATDGGAKINPHNDPTVKTLQQEIAAAQSQEASDYAKWQCQLYGVSAGGSKCGPAGSGPLAQLDQERYQNDVAAVGSLQQQLTSRLNVLSANDSTASQARVATARQQLPGVQAELHRDLVARQSQAAAFSAANRAGSDLLARIDALNAVSDRDGAVRASTILLTLLFIMLGALPALIGILQPSRAYESVLAAVQRQEAVRAHYRLHSDAEAAQLAEALDRDAARIAPAPTARADAEAADQALRAMQDMRRPDGSP